MNNMTYEEWEAKYKPIPNHITGECCSFETYGDELDFVMSQKPEHIWTEIDGDNGVYIVDGYHYVNRIQYFVCEVPWTDENEFVPVQMWVQCECANEDNDFEGELDCPNCESGTRDFFPETIEEYNAIEELQRKAWA